ncbi:coiled-coil domain-containing protein 93 isoform X6 [Phalaenopsis equestris]|uniref:coiled-coil domain-containing protein 93 isoform X6 n=1 Tax=Phalaenopsis equestris TaxID=78828 RepID=UPI0009E21E84|nr:coiled-coil domain-containing protein 93 isoform X6 [Phalaenopsis equestris]
MSGDREKMVNRKPNAKIQKKQRMNLGIKGLGGAVGDSGDNGVESSSSFLDQQQEKKTLRDMSDRRDFIYQRMTTSARYERRFSELYAQIQKKHHLTRRHYATYNALVEIKELMLKEASLLNSVNLQFKDAMTTPSGRYKLLDSLEVIVKGTKHKLEKAKLDLSAEQRVCDSLKEKHITAVAEQKNFSSLLKTFQDACTEYERLRQLATT